ncbi:MAG: RNA methyltransferase [Treponema sp.]|nr:RNA methyltransferase [Treponema sp.]
MVEYVMDLSHIVIVLCRATEPGNVGAICRVMKNMGLSRLRMVSPGVLDEIPLLARAIHAEDVWRSAAFYDSIADATADCSLVVGTTRRRGRKRKSITLDPRALTAWIAQKPQNYNNAPLALVFGNERTGLDDEELNLCTIASHIPVSDTFPSINLSHAVQIYAYELFLAFGDAAENQVKGAWVPLELSAVNTLTAEITDTLASFGFYKYPGRDEQTRFLRDIICRAGLTEKEGRYFKDMLVKAARMGV